MTNEYRLLIGKPDRKGSFGRSRRCGKAALNWILGKEKWKALIGFIWIRIGTGGGLL
jgi:hypothetical protein